VTEKFPSAHLPNELPEEHHIVRALVRYGIPALILIFYVTASLRFDYTPDSTFLSLLSLRQSSPASLWSALLSAAGLFRVDALIAAKVFSLFFSCFVILYSYLIANEVLRDHLLALCVALAVAVQSWLLQLAPSGSGVNFALFLSLATIFFLLRNEYIIATIFAGLASLVAWQAVGLLFVLAVDAFINSVNKNHSTKIMATIALVYFGVILPWILYSLYVGKALLPNEIVVSDVPTLLPQIAFEGVMLVGLMFVGIVLLSMHDREMLRSQTASVLWMIFASFSHQRMFVLTLPLVIVYAFLAARQIAENVRLAKHAHLIAGFLAAGILAYSQFVVHPAAHRLMDDAIAEAHVLQENAVWLKLNAKENESVTPPIGHEGLIQFYSERKIENEQARFVVTREKEIANAELVFDPVKENPELLAHHYTLWRRK
jgi:hypothetical protein